MVCDNSSRSSENRVKATMNTESVVGSKLPKVFSKNMLNFLLRLFLGGLFIVSGTIKLLDLNAFADIIDAFEILPKGLCFGFAACLSTMEVVSGIAAIAGSRYGYAVIGVMLVGFIVVLGYAIGMGYDIDCGCFGPEDPESVAFSGLKVSFFRDIILIGITAYLFFISKKHNKKNKRSQNEEC